MNNYNSKITHNNSSRTIACPNNLDNSNIKNEAIAFNKNNYKFLKNNDKVFSIAYKRNKTESSKSFHNNDKKARKNGFINKNSNIKNQIDKYNIKKVENNTNIARKNTISFS